MTADKAIGCDVCGELKPIVWHGFVYGTETSACAKCVYDVKDLCAKCERHVDDCVCAVPSP